MTRQAISELLVRVRAADGPDREIDRDMSELFGRRNEHGVLIIADRWLSIAPLTSSLDAIVALIEQELPDRNRASGNNHVLPASKSQAYADIPPYFAYVGDGRGNGTVLRETGQTEALALCAAFLSALSAKLETMETNDDQR